MQTHTQTSKRILNSSHAEKKWHGAPPAEAEADAALPLEVENSPICLNSAPKTRNSW
jgi:hypothetical protein